MVLLALQSYKLRRCASTSPTTNSKTSAAATALRSASEAATALPSTCDLLELLPLESHSGHCAKYDVIGHHACAGTVLAVLLLAELTHTI
jgi:hypothetical protein